MSHIINFWKDIDNTHPDLNSKCCGCGACETACPVNAITMRYDSEGFIYPLVNNSICLDCGKCQNVCPVSNKCESNHPYFEVFAGYSSDVELMRNCASGGFASELSRLIINKGGIVFGVVYDKDYLKSYYAVAESDANLLAFRGSKYVQSEKRNIYREVKENLINGKLVLFIGLPCDISALQRYLTKVYENLYTCELICMGVTSYKIASDYKEWTEKRNKSKLVYINSRSKSRGWFVPHLEEHFQNGKKKFSTLFGSYYGYGFQIYNRPSCYQCQYRGQVGVADVRIGDFWGVKKSDPFWNRNGVSCILVHSKRSIPLIDEMRKTGYNFFDVDYKTVVLDNMSSYKNKSEKYLNLRNQFSLEYKKNGLVSACWKTASLGFYIKFITPERLASPLKHLYHSFIDRRK